METTRRIERVQSASQVGKGMRMLSIKQDVGRGEERVECGPCVCDVVRSREDQDWKGRGEKEKSTHETLFSITAELHDMKWRPVETLVIPRERAKSVFLEKIDLMPLSRCWKDNERA